jgi:hypothetical protein
MEMLAKVLRAGAGLPAALLIVAAHVAPAQAQVQSSVGVLINVPSTGNDCVAGTCSAHTPIPFGGSQAIPFSTTRSFPNGDSYQLDGVVGIGENASGTSLPGKMSVTITSLGGPGLNGTTVGEPDNFLLSFFLDYTPNGNANELTVLAIGSFSSGVGAQSSVQVAAQYCGNVNSATVGPIMPASPSMFSESSMTFVPACPNQLLVDTSHTLAFRAGTKAGAFIQLGTYISASLAATHDANGDTFSDILWRDANGNLAIWAMNGASVLFGGAIAGGVPAGWSIVGQRDFNGDGKSDLLWQDATGDIAIWFLNGIQLPNPAVVATVPTTWAVIGTGDFNGDHLGDILWQDSSGNLAVWLMNGANVSSSAGLSNLPSAWKLAGTGDFNGDGKTDLLWRDSGGNTAIWFMNGVQVSSAASVGNVAGWSVVGTGDFNGDGMSDIVWRDSAGDTAIWLMTSASILSAGVLGTISTTWSIATTGDFNGDGKSDLLWRDGSGNTVVWFMNGTSVLSSALVGNVPISWTVQSTNAE